MDRLRQVFATIGKSLSALTKTQLVAILALAGLAILSLVLVAVLTSKRTMVALVPGAPAATQQAAAALAQERGISTGRSGADVTVPIENVYALRGALGEAGKLSDDSVVMFANLSSKQHWMNPKQENDRQANFALQNEIARVIANFPSIGSASVIIDAPEPVGLGNAYRKPTAMATIFTKGGRPLTQTTVDAISGLIAGAKAGLAVQDVVVVDGTTQRQFKTRAPGDFNAGDYMEHAAKIEDRVQGKLLEALKYIPGVIVAVNAQTDVRKVIVSESRALPDGKGSVSILQDSKNKTLDTSQSSTGAEGGVRSNVADDISKGGGTGSKTNDTTEDSTFKVEIGKRKEDITDPRGMPTKVNVTINVPREYIAALVKSEKNDPKAEVTTADIDGKFPKEQERLSKDIQPLVESIVSNTAGPGTTTQPGTVVVSMIPIPVTAAGAVGLPLGMATIVNADGGGGGLLGSASGALGGGIVKQAVLGVLALAALGMMFMLVRKAAKPIDLPTPQELVGAPPTLESGADIVGEADESQTAMEGVELADDQLKTKKMLEQVQDMVKKNPKDSAALLNRWIAVDQ